MNDTDFDFVKLPPKNSYETPEEIRRQRDLYRDIVDSQMLEMWRGVKREDWNSPDGCRGEIRQIIVELEAELSRG